VAVRTDTHLSEKEAIMGLRILLIAFIVALVCFQADAQTLEVKAGRSAIVKSAPDGNAEELLRLSAGTRVTQIGTAPRYYRIRLADGQVGWSYKGSFVVVSTQPTSTSTEAGTATAEALLGRQDVLKIIVLDVEVGDATLIICPADGGQRDVILIDTGEDDSDRITDELTGNGFVLSGKPITRFIVTHYDGDHLGAAEDVIPLSQIVYDHGDNIKRTYKKKYQRMTSQPGVDRRTMTLSYQETFSGGVTVECVAVNRATDFDPGVSPSSPNSDNANSIALIVSFDGFEYFTGGDLTKVPERSLATGIRNCDVYHVNHHGSKATSSVLEFVQKLDPEVSIASNGTRHGHPTAIVAKRLIDNVGSRFYQTNFNPDDRAHKPDPKFVADDTYHEDDEDEDAEGAAGTIRIIIDPVTDRYFVVMPGLPLTDATFDIEK
jgi:beta-lactamase superfamily II metal-dependent hydrolase